VSIIYNMNLIILLHCVISSFHVCGVGEERERSVHSFNSSTREKKTKKKLELLGVV
jgi:hypothetical protein